MVSRWEKEVCLSGRKEGCLSGRMVECKLEVRKDV
jgi:hypothetical protein